MAKARATTGPTADDHLSTSLNELHAGQPSVRRNAIRELRAIGTPEAVEALKGALFDADSSVRHAAAKAVIAATAHGARQLTRVVKWMERRSYSQCVQLGRLEDRVIALERRLGISRQLKIREERKRRNEALFAKAEARYAKKNHAK